MSTNQRRKRRSYSCGPCKKLKLKCDLQIPCRSCERSRRADKCLEDPPQPPSEEELERIANRRRKKTQWKQRNSAISETEVSIVIDTSHPPMETSSPLDSKYVPPQSLHTTHNPAWQPEAAPSAPPAPSAPAPPAPAPPAPTPFYTALPLPGVSPPPFPFPGSIPLGVVPILPSQYSNGSTHINEHLDPPIKQEPDLETPNINHIDRQISIQFKDQVPETIYHQQLAQLQYPQPIAPPPFEACTPRGPSQIDIEEHEDRQTLIALLEEETAQFRAKFAYSNEFFNQLYFNHRQASKDFVEAVLPTARAIVMFVDFLRDISINNDAEFYTNVDTLRMVSLGISIMINGLLYINDSPELVSSKAEVLVEWNSLLLSIHAKLRKNLKLTDALYNITWVLVRHVYLLANKDYDALCELQQDIVVFLYENKDFADLVRERDENMVYPDTTEFHIIGRLWLLFRLVELEVPRIQRWQVSDSFKLLLTSIVPHKEAAEAIFRYPYSYVINQEFIMKLASYYYKRTRKAKTIIDLIRSYHLLYTDAYMMLNEELNDLDSRLAANNYVEQPGDGALVIKNQLTLSFFVRWLSFIRMETRYFPSLRYASYLTSQINLFDLALRFDNQLQATSDGTRTFFEGLMNGSLYYIRIFYHCLVCHGMLLLVLVNFLPAEHLGIDISITAIDYQWVFDECYTSYNEITLRLWKALKQCPLHLGCTSEFQTTWQVITTIRSLVDELLQAPRDSFTQLVTYIDESMDNTEVWQHLHRAFFGSELVFVEYVEKLWDLFEYIENNATKSIPIARLLEFNQQLLENNHGRSRGIPLTPEIVDSFVEQHSRPSYETE